MSAGPGSFTGVRIGVSLIKGLAFGRNIPCIGVSSLEALSRNADGIGGRFIACPVMDARRNQLYNAIFLCDDDRRERLCEDRLVSAEKLAAELSEFSLPIYFFGDGYDIAKKLSRKQATRRKNLYFKTARPSQRPHLKFTQKPKTNPFLRTLRFHRHISVLRRRKENITQKRRKNQYEKIALAADHAGYLLKGKIIAYLTEKGYECVNLGTDTADSVDYPVYANKLCESILSGECECGILICGTGIGMSIAANRHKGIRAALCYAENCVELTRQHNNANVLCLGARVTDDETAMKLVDKFLSTDYLGGRHDKRIAMLDE